MEFKILAPGGNELQITEALPHSFKGLILPSRSGIEVKAAFGSMVFQHYEAPGFTIWYSNYDVKHPAQLVGRADNPVLELHMQFGKTFLSDWDGVGAKTVKQHQYNLTYTPFVFNRVQFTDAALYQTFDIHFTLPFLQQLAPAYPVLSRFLEAIHKAQPSTIFHIDHYLSPSMIHHVHQMLHCPYIDGVADHFFRCCVEHLLIEALYTAGHQHPGAIKYSAYDRDCIYMARELAISDFENPLTITELARKVGINENKLKYGFKHFFGTSIFNYVQAQRLEHARQSLLDTDLPIEDIAYVTGYNYVSNFKKRFQKHFGYSAAQLRKHKKS